ncbi:hypothetical protein E2I00_000996 [Balaenoptera physalus]|uniref:Uncharacterized protein n=1 Tax=Balaenoptera physalus TaxID=9770 RepID=A0A6A1Q5J7_BALPH|nr:hypothetical protein E2I00_000996 [Balaenoptera physalus]
MKLWVRWMCDQFLMNVIMLERKNFKSGKFIYRVQIKPGVVFQYLNPRKLILEGHINKCVSNSPSLIQQAMAVKNKHDTFKNLQKFSSCSNSKMLDDNANL